MKQKLLTCVEALKDIRRCMQSDADPSIVAALSAAIAKLESCAVEDDPTQPCWLKRRWEHSPSLATL
jgi:hypothetical protein